MPYQKYHLIHHKAELRHAALAANLQDFPELEGKVNRLGGSWPCCGAHRRAGAADRRPAGGFEEDRGVAPTKPGD